MTKPMRVTASAVALTALLTACTTGTQTRRDDCKKPGVCTTDPTTTPPVPTADLQHVAVPAPWGIGDLTIPKDYGVAVLERFPAGRVSYPVILGDAVYWATDQHTTAAGRFADRAVDRLDMHTGHVTTVATTTGASYFNGLAAGADGLIAAVETYPRTCPRGTGCIRPTLELLRPGRTPLVLATSDVEYPSPDSPGYGLWPTAAGALLETMHDGKLTLRLWRSTKLPMLALGTDVPFSFAITAVGDMAVGEAYGRGLWTTGDVPLPAAINGGSFPSGSATRLAWLPVAGDSTVQVSTLTDGHYTTPADVPTDGASVDWVNWINDCQLVISEHTTGLFAYDACKPGARAVPLLNASQVVRLRPGFGYAPGFFAFVLKGTGGDVLTVLSAPAK